MKITPSHFSYMFSAIQPLSATIPARREALRNDPRVKDLEKRLRWDLCYAAGLSAWICDNLYSYLDDVHIDTALRAIIKELQPTN